METLIAVVLLALGIVLIVKGGDFFVDAASWMAEVSGIPKLIVGATVVSFATTLPELLVSAFAAFDGRKLLLAGDTAAAEGMVEMSIGNAVGSVTANIGLILAIALICMPVVIRRKDYLLKSVLMISAAAYLAVICVVFKELHVLPAIVLLVIFVIAMWDNIRESIKGMREQRAKGEKDEKDPITKRVIVINVLKFVAGAAGIVIGAQLLIDNGTILAKVMGVPERIIAVTVVAVGTSLPELVTTITAIVKKQASLSAGNILGANIIDMTLILPICAAIYGGTLPVSFESMVLDIPVCLALGCIAMIPTIITKRFHRRQGIMLLVIYAAYVVFTCMDII